MAMTPEQKLISKKARQLRDEAYRVQSRRLKAALDAAAAAAKASPEESAFQAANDEFDANMADRNALDAEYRQALAQLKERHDAKRATVEAALEKANAKRRATLDRRLAMQAKLEAAAWVGFDDLKGHAQFHAAVWGDVSDYVAAAKKELGL